MHSQDQTQSLGQQARDVLRKKKTERNPVSARHQGYRMGERLNTGPREEVLIPSQGGTFGPQAIRRREKVVF